MRFCTGCQCYREEEGGVMRVGRKSGRWICKPCIERKTESIYRNTSGKTVDVKLLMSKLYSARGER